MNENGYIFESSREKFEFFTFILQQQMKNMNVAIGFDMENKKLVLLDAGTKNISRIDLDELNKNSLTMERN